MSRERPAQGRVSVDRTQRTICIVLRNTSKQSVYRPTLTDTPTQETQRAHSVRLAAVSDFRVGLGGLAAIRHSAKVAAFGRRRRYHADWRPRAGRRGRDSGAGTQACRLQALAGWRRRAPAAGLPLYKKANARLIRGEDEFIAEIIRELRAFARLSHARA
jgi:hypothetical protein